MPCALCKADYHTLGYCPFIDEEEKRECDICKETTYLFTADFNGCSMGMCWRCYFIDKAEYGKDMIGTGDAEFKKAMKFYEKEQGKGKCNICKKQWEKQKNICGWRSTSKHDPEPHNHLHGDLIICCPCSQKMREDYIDRFDSPNNYPYKKCSSCSERKSCGSYNDDKQWICETCS